MERKSMGQFIAALRRASGMTQQQVAERLNVSDKAVSRWERDASAPDLSVIPALAEMFGVTCDELLRGERLSAPERPSGGEVKVERQMRTMINRALSGFRTLCWISLALSAVGLVFMLGISYGFYRPVIGFAVMMVFITIAALLAVLAVNRLKMVKEDNELFDRAEEDLQAAYARSLGDYSFAAFFGALAVVLFSLPLILFTSRYVESVLSIGSYLLFCFGGVVLLLLLVWLKAKGPYTAWINGRPVVWMWGNPLTLSGRMTLWQVGLTVLAVVLFAIAPYFETDPEQTSWLYEGMCVAGLICLLGNIFCFALFMARNPDGRRGLALPGVRNMLYIVSAFMATEWHVSGFYSSNENGWGSFERYDFWYHEVLLQALGLALLVTLVFGIIRWLAERRNKP